MIFNLTLFRTYFVVTRNAVKFLNRVEWSVSNLLLLLLKLFYFILFPAAREIFVEVLTLLIVTYKLTFREPVKHVQEIKFVSSRY